MKICLLSSMHPPRDKRVFDKEAISLAQAGFHVVHLAPDDGRRAHEQGVDIITYRRPGGILGRLLYLHRLYRLAIQVHADVYHCNEVDSWFIGVLLKIIHRKKVVFDVHEHYPSTYAESRFPPRFRPLVASMVRAGFRILIPFTDRLVFAKRSVATDFIGSEQKQVLVQNFTSLAYRDAGQPHEYAGNVADASSTVTAIHLGLISRARGWPQLLEALAQSQSKNLHLHIVGTFNDGSREAFERRVAELGIGERIIVEEWMPFAQAYQRILTSHIGLVLFQPGIQNHVFALPHKMFDYMLAGIPVIVPEYASEVASIIKETDCGVLVDASNPDEIVKAFDLLVSNVNERKRLGANGRRAVLEQYNWEAESEKLVKMYVDMAGEVQ